MRQVAESEELLPPLEAAHHLGVTPELLFGFTRRSFRTSPSRTRRLRTVERGGATMFAIDELDDFDLYLKQPWVEPGSPRTNPPKCIEDHLRAESGNQCSRCGSGVAVQTAHIDQWATSRSHHPHNLIRLCSGCHIEHDLHGSIPTLELRSIKARLIDRTRTMIERRIEPVALRFRPPRPVEFFVGYSDALAGLRRGLQAGRSISVIGVAGVGKTQLALQALKDIDTRRPVIWIDVESHSSLQDVASALQIALSDSVVSCERGRIASRLDSLQACVVFDGIEQGSRTSIDDLEDFVADLVEQTSSAQFLFTSQLNLQRIPSDGTVRLRRMDRESSRRLFVASIAQVKEIDSKTEAKLLEFCEGHPLTIRLVGSLVDFFGSSKTALDRISSFGAKAVKLQKRERYDRQTSLELCLALAYKSLDPSEQRLLWLVSNSPAGMFTRHIEVPSFEIPDPRFAAAGLRRWNLVQCLGAGEPFERLYALSPVRSFADAHWRDENPDQADGLLERLVTEFAMMAAVIDRDRSSPDSISHMMHRYSQELPNLIRVIEVAWARPESAELANMAYVVCSALMRYFFLLGFSKQGTEIMHSGADLALRRGESKRASDFAIQLISLAGRSRDPESKEAAIRLYNSLAQSGASAADPLVHANLCVARAMMALDDEKPIDAEMEAKEAVAIYQSQRAETGEEDAEDNANDLAAALSLLGGAFLAQAMYADAKDAYGRALEIQSQQSLAVNRGQLLHQIGNCEAHIGNYEAATQCYAEAAHLFHAIGMQEYLANALGELGFVLIEHDFEALDSKLIDLIPDGFTDVANHVRRGFGDTGISDYAERIGIVRKLFGIVVLVSFCESQESLRTFAESLKSEVISWKSAKADGSDGSKLTPVALLKFVLAIASDLATTEVIGAEGEEALAGCIEGLAFGLHRSWSWARRHLLLFQWFAKYLDRRWDISGVTAELLEEACETAERTGRFSLRAVGSP
jgi:tetratricopeptide (TPR) repeat protein